MVNGVPKVHESTDSPAMQIDNITYENHTVKLHLLNIIISTKAKGKYCRKENIIRLTKYPTL